MKIIINRNWQDTNQTLGTCTIVDNKGKPLFTALSLERGWRNNENMVSCIPVGTYPVKLEYSNRFKQDLWEIKNVPGRAETKFHSANYWFQLNGCIALGNSLADINKDGYQDITASKMTMAKFHKILQGLKETQVTITANKGIS